MIALLMAALLAAGAPSPLEAARDHQDRAALQKMLNEYAAAAAKAPRDAAAQRRVVLAASYLAEVQQELRDKKMARQAAEQGIPAA